MKTRPGKVEKPESQTWLWKDLFRQKVVEKFVGTDGSMELLKSEEGQAKIDEARSETTSALGYTLEEAVKDNELEDLHRELQWAKPEPESKFDDETEPMDVM